MKRGADENPKQWTEAITLLKKKILIEPLFVQWTSIKLEDGCIPQYQPYKKKFYASSPSSQQRGKPI